MRDRFYPEELPLLRDITSDQISIVKLPDLAAVRWDDNGSNIQRKKGNSMKAMKKVHITHVTYPSEAFPDWMVLPKAFSSADKAKEEGLAWYAKHKGSHPELTEQEAVHVVDFEIDAEQTHVYLARVPYSLREEFPSWQTIGLFPSKEEALSVSNAWYDQVCAANDWTVEDGELVDAGGEVVDCLAKSQALSILDIPIV